METPQPASTQAQAACQNQPRALWVDVTRVFAALFIIMTHLPLQQPMQGYSQMLFLYGRVPFFLLISGYFVAHHLRSHPCSSSLYWQRTLLLGVPYVFWCLFGYACDSAMAGSWLHSNSEGASFFASIFGIGCYPYNGPMWFIRDLMVYSLFAALLLRLGHKVIVLVLVCAACPLLLNHHGYPRAEGLCFFALGVLLSVFGLENIKKYAFSTPLAGLCGMLALGFWYSWNPYPPSICGPLLGTYGLMCLGVLCERYLPAVTRFLLRFTPACFLSFSLHFPMVQYYRKHDPGWPDWVQLLLVAPLIFVLVFFCYKLLELLSPRLCAVLCAQHKK